MIHKMQDFLWIVLGCAMMAISVGYFVYSLNFAYNDFMAQCVQDHKQYECRVIYRSGQ